MSCLEEFPLPESPYLILQLWFRYEYLLSVIICMHMFIVQHTRVSTWKKILASLGGLEPPTFRLTAERANRLRHRDDIHKVCTTTYL